MSEGNYATGVSDAMNSFFGDGLMVAATGGSRSKNPHPMENADWQEWMRGFQAWEDAPKVEIDMPS